MQPFAELQMDTLVLPANIADESGYVGIFVMSDDFTGWVWRDCVSRDVCRSSDGAASSAISITRVMRFDIHLSFVGAEMP